MSRIRGSLATRSCPCSSRSGPRRFTRSRRSSTRPRARSSVRIFLGITGASGAPYAARLVETLSAADVELGLSDSAPGIDVLPTELYAHARLSRYDTLPRLLEH